MNSFTIAITGPESCGKSTLTSDLSVLLKCDFTKEISVSYLKDKGKYYTENDVENIAKLQFAENQQASLTNYKILDTETLVTKVWYEHKYNKHSEIIDKLWEQQKIDLYALCYPDVEWKYSELRENPMNRLELFEMYEYYLLKSMRKYIIISGSRSERINTVLQYLKEKKI